MSLYTFALILLWAFVVVFIIALIIITFVLGRHSIKDNPTKAYIFRKTGRHISKPIKGEMIGKPVSRGSKFKYGKHIVLVPISYADNYFCQRRMIFINRAGQVIASPFTDDTKLADKENEELIYEVIEGHIGSDAIKALKGKNVVPSLLIIIIAFAMGILALTAFNYIRASYLEQLAPVLPTANTTPVIKPVPEIKIIPAETQ